VPQIPKKKPRQSIKPGEFPNASPPSPPSDVSDISCPSFTDLDNDDSDDLSLDHIFAHFREKRRAMEQAKSSGMYSLLISQLE